VHRPTIARTVFRPALRFSNPLESERRGRRRFAHRRDAATPSAPYAGTALAVFFVVNRARRWPGPTALRRSTADMAEPTNIEDLRERARRRLPAVIYAYVENGGYEEETLRRNRTDIESIALVPHVLNDVSERSTATILAGDRATMPVALAPVGALGITHVNAEIAAARAANDFGVPFCLSTLSICTIEEVAATTHAPLWFQLYMMRDKGVTTALVERARESRCSVLVLSLDLHVRSVRHAEQRHGLGAPPKFSLANIWGALTHPSWLVPMIQSKERTFGNLRGLVPDATDLGKITCWLEEQFDPTLGVKDIEWARKVWPGKILIKGVMDAEEARRCIAHGADGVVVSNHGGRQVDGAASTVSVLPAVVAAVNGTGQVLVDSGIRSGVDVLKMLALGADGCLVGRAYVYGVAALGERGVTKALDILRTELDQNMALCGVRDVRDLRFADLIRGPVVPPSPVVRARRAS
jgi:L-lactate dehydrogenase (cytochrome)